MLTSNLRPIRLCRRRCDSRDVKVREGRGLTAQIKPSWKLWKLCQCKDLLWKSLQRLALTSRREAYECLTKVMKKHGADGVFWAWMCPGLLSEHKGLLAQKPFMLWNNTAECDLWGKRSRKCCYETHAVMRLSVWSNFYSRLSWHNLKHLY